MSVPPLEAQRIVCECVMRSLRGGQFELYKKEAKKLREKCLRVFLFLFKFDFDLQLLPFSHLEVNLCLF